MNSLWAISSQGCFERWKCSSWGPATIFPACDQRDAQSPVRLHSWSGCADRDAPSLPIRTAFRHAQIMMRSCDQSCRWKEGGCANHILISFPVLLSWKTKKLAIAELCTNTFFWLRIWSSNKKFWFSKSLIFVQAFYVYAGLLLIRAFIHKWTGLRQAHSGIH